MKKAFHPRNIVILMIIVTLLLYISGKSPYILAICKYIPYPNILYLSIVLTGAYICFFLLPKLKSSVSTSIGVILLSFFLCAFTLFFYGPGEKPEVTCINSPDDKHELVFFEYRHMFYDKGLIYEQVNPFYMKKLHYYMVGFGKPISNDSYDITWYSDHFVLYLYTNEYDSKEIVHY